MSDIKIIYQHPMIDEIKRVEATKDKDEITETLRKALHHGEILEQVKIDDFYLQSHIFDQAENGYYDEGCDYTVYIQEELDGDYLEGEKAFTYAQVQKTYHQLVKLEKKRAKR